MTADDDWNRDAARHFEDQEPDDPNLRWGEWAARHFENPPDEDSP